MSHILTLPSNFFLCSRSLLEIVWKVLCASLSRWEREGTEQTIMLRRCDSDVYNACRSMRDISSFVGLAMKLWHIKLPPFALHLAFLWYFENQHMNVFEQVIFWSSDNVRYYWVYFLNSFARGLFPKMMCYHFMQIWFWKLSYIVNFLVYVEYYKSRGLMISSAQFIQ